LYKCIGYIQNYLPINARYQQVINTYKKILNNYLKLANLHRKNGRDSGLNLGLESTAHQFQEYTYKKITPCDVCSQVLRGHTRQGLKCRVCKLNVHLDCQDKVGRCQAKSRLLRRQKSTSEIETRVTPAQEEEDYGVPTPLQPSTEAGRKRRLFGGVRSFSVFGNRSSQGRSISLPEKPPQYAPGTRPFGQPLVLGGSQENGNLDDIPEIPANSKKGSNKNRWYYVYITTVYPQLHGTHEQILYIEAIQRKHNWNICLFPDVLSEWIFNTDKLTIFLIILDNILEPKAIRLRLCYEIKNSINYHFKEPRCFHVIYLGIDLYPSCK